jgi:hypothetical protein
VEKKFNSPNPVKENPSSFMPPIQGQKMNVPIINNFDAPKARIHPPQSAKPTTHAGKEPPQSARVIQSAQDFHKKGAEKPKHVESP